MVTHGSTGHELLFPVKQWAQRWEKVKLAHDSVLELDPFLLTQTFLTQDVFLKSKLKLS